jgi:hypothetical protein
MLIGLAQAGVNLGTAVALGARIIFRERLNVRGLNTAATPERDLRLDRPGFQPPF